MDFHQRITLVKRNLAEAVTEEELEKLLREKEHPSVYLGLAPTGKIHIGYFVPFMKLKDFIKAGFKVTLLLADLHAHLDDRKAPFELLDKRVAYYKEASLGILESLGADAKQVSFVRGTDFQLFMENKLYINVISGAIVATNDGGSMVFDAKSQPTGQVLSAQTRPTAAPPGWKRPCRGSRTARSGTSARRGSRPAKG